MRLAALILLWSAWLGAQQSSIEGVVIDTATQKPLSGVHVRLIAMNFASQGPNLDAAYGSMSDEAGHFSVASLAAGSYILLLERTGYVQPPPKNTGAIPITNVVIKAGQRLTDYKLEMSPHAVILGRVVDEFGDPVQNAQVQANPVTPGAQAINLFGGQGSSTDDRGEFRIVTGPGKYYVQASPRMYGMNYRPNEPPEIRTDGTSEVTYQSTYYPSVASKDHAAVVEAGAGADVTGIEIRLATAAVQPVANAGGGLSVSGVVTGMPEGVTRVNISLLSGESADKLNNSNGTMTGPDGKFSFSHLQPGFYTAIASYSSGKTPLQSQPVEFRLDTASETNVQLVLAPGAELTGTLEMAGDAPGTPVEKRTVRLEASGMTQFGMEQTGGEVDKTGAFRIAGLMPGRFRVTVDPLPDNAYIKSVQLDGAEAKDGVVDLSHGVRGSRVKVTVSRDGAQLSGRVVDKDGEPIQNSLVVVLLLEEGKLPDAQDIDRTMTRVSSDGTYTAKGLHPGKYRLLALDAFRYVGSLADGGDEQKAYKELAARGEAIEIKPGDKITKDLKALEKEEGDAKPKQ